MAKGKAVTVFYCQNCGYESSKWMGQCPGCREWNTMVEEKATSAVRGNGNGVHKREAARPSCLSEVSIQEESRMQTQDRKSVV